MWHHAAVTRLRIIDQAHERYSERVVVDDRGLVHRIERRYRPSIQGSWRVMLTSKRRVASLWMAARNVRDGWHRIRRAVPWANIDHWKCAGATFLEGRQEQQLLVELVRCWPRPDQSIAGLEEIEPGVWHAAGDSVTDGVVRIGPLWLGRGQDQTSRLCVVGPAWMPDRSPLHPPDSSSAILKDIVDVDLPSNPTQSDSLNPGRLYPLVKRTFDVVCSVAALTLLLPVMLLVSACILLEDGRPLLFGHRRQGRDGKLFRCWKFRTMQRDAEKIVRDLNELNLADGPQVMIPNDPRVTRLGRILRATNLDEIPQFWNVLVGQMSLVGPRPSPDDENQYCPAWRDLRLSVRPGITGLWQLKRTRGRGEDFQEWIKYDIQYVQAANFWFDMFILTRTAWLMLTRRRVSGSK